jgi:lipoprotein NlpD
MTDGPRFRAFLPILRYRKLIGFLLLGVMLLSCSASSIRGNRSRGVYHVVKSGETLSAIARAYLCNIQELAEVNNISKPDDIAVGSVIFIPDAVQILDDVLTESRLQGGGDGTRTGVAPAADTKAAPPAAISRKETPKKATAAEGEKRGERVSAESMAKDRAALSRAADRDMASRKVSEKTPVGEDVDRTAKKREDNGSAGEIQFNRKQFIWPVNGRVVAKFGMESVTTDYKGKKVETAKIMNNGIRIAAGVGTPVIAAGAGKVIYSMMLERFGNTIIIEHDDDFKTVYYDLGKRLVETLQKVKKGEPIAYIGESSAANNETYMNFEIRHRNKPRNPLFFLP